MPTYGHHVSFHYLSNTNIFNEIGYNNVLYEGERAEKLNNTHLKGQTIFDFIYRVLIVAMLVFTKFVLF